MRPKPFRLISRAAMMLLMMLLTTTTAWAFKTETAVTYTVSRSGNTIYIKNDKGTTVSSWTASETSIGINTNYYWKANEPHDLENSMSVKPSANVYVYVTSAYVTESTTFTFTTPSDIAISGVTFKKGSEVVAATSTSSEPGTTFTVTLASGESFTGFVVTYGYISGSCGTNAKWSLAKQNRHYTALTISGSGAMSNYSGSDAPWGNDLTSATIGSGITSIGNYAFNGCSALTQVTIQKTDGLVTLGSNGLNGCNALQYIVVPTPALAVQYKTATNWSTSKDKLRVEFGSYLFTATNEGDTPAYAITSETDLRNLATAINSGSTGNASGKTFRQTGNITFSSTNFEPIGRSSSRYFKGTYDGGGYTISDLHVSHLDGIDNYGLFGWVEGMVKNVRLVNPSAGVGNSPSTHYGALIGTTYSTNSQTATVQNCVVINPTIDGSGQYLGAIIGSNENSSTLQNLYYYGGNRNNAIGGDGSGTNVGRARKVTIGSGISSVTPALDATATDLDNGFVYDNKTYYREGLELTLINNLSGQTGYHVICKAGDNILTGNTYTVNSTDGDVTLTALLEYNTYTVQFDKNHTDATGYTGTMSDQTFTYDVAQNLTANAFTRTGYTFAGWATSANGNVVYSDEQSVSNLTDTDGGTVTLYAKWTPADYTITYNLNGGILETDKNSYTIESPDITLDQPTRTGFVFGGWYTNSGLTGEAVTTISHGSSGNKEYWAKWLLPYIDADGQLRGIDSYTVLTGSESTSVEVLSSGWYVVTGNVSYKGGIACDNMHLLLCDGASLTIHINNNFPINTHNLTIYGQTQGTGTLTVSANNDCIFAYNTITINGGKITATSNQIDCCGICTNNGNITINGGSVEAKGDYGIYARNGNTITLGWRNAGDRIYASRCAGTVKIADGQSFHNGSEVISGTVSDMGKVNGKTLVGVDVLEDAATNDVAALAIRLGGKQTNVALNGRTLYKDGDWNTLCLPFDVVLEGSPLENAKARTLTEASIEDKTLNLTFDDAVTTLTAGVPYIIKWTKDDENPTIVAPVFSGVTIDASDNSFDNGVSGDERVRFIGTYKSTTFTDEDKSILFLGAENTLYYPQPDIDTENPANSKYPTIGAQRAYFKIGEDGEQARALTAFNISFGEEHTGIESLTPDPSPKGEGSIYWYSLDGRRLSGKPTARGIYIRSTSGRLQGQKDGRKVVVSD